MNNNSKKWFWLSVGIITLLFIYNLGPVLSPFLTAMLLAYMNNPLVSMLERYKIPRTLGIVIVFILIFGILAFLILTLIPLLERQIILLINTLPQILVAIQKSVIPWINQKFKLGTSIDSTAIIDLLKAHWQQAGSFAVDIFATISKQGINLILWLSNLLIIPVVLFYLLRDWGSLLENFQALIPRSVADTVNRLARECDEVLGAFFRGQLLVMLGLGIVYSVGLMIVGLNLALLVGLLSGLVSIVPYLGFIVGIVVASIAAIFQFHDTIHLLYVAVAFIVGQTIESTILTPLLVGDRIGLHPVAVIFAVLAGAQLFGFVGVLLALPFAAVLMVWLRFFKSKYIKSSVYQDEPPNNLKANPQEV